jgi:transaldolase/glucose-6-phosphate isomerase
LFSGPRWDALAAKGAHTQRLLWASTGTKNPSYPDTLYVDTLVGRDTVNTMPPATMDAFREHGTPKPDAVKEDVAGARQTLAALKQHGISLDGVTDELVVDGVKQFADAFDKLFATIKSRSGEMREQRRAAS